MKDTKTPNNQDLLDLLLMPVEKEMDFEEKSERQTALKKRLDEILLELDGMYSEENE